MSESAYGWVHRGMSWFVTKLSIFIRTQKVASAAARAATDTKTTRNDVCYLDKDVFEAQLLKPNSFGWRSFFLRSSEAAQNEAGETDSIKCPFVLKSIL